jgi:hypothetical protein
MTRGGANRRHLCMRAMSARGWSGIPISNCLYDRWTWRDHQKRPKDKAFPTVGARAVNIDVWEGNTKAERGNTRYRMTNFTG